MDSEGRGTGGRTRRQGLCRAALFGLAIALLPAASARAELIDRVLAVVNNEVITWSELRQAMTLNEALSGPPKDRQAFAAEVLGGLINRELLLQEARRLAGAEVTEAEVNAEVERFTARLGSEQARAALLARAQMTDEDLRRMFAERLVAERFLEKRVGLFVRVGREDAERYYREHQEAFAGKRFRDVEKQISLLLTARKTDAEITQYLADLRNRADVRVNPL